MDEALRALERRWRAGEPGALEALARAHRQAGRELPWEVIAALPRWEPLVDFAARWCAHPLSPEDGVPAEAIARKEAELGFRLPAALREWYRLVGVGLRQVYDIPTLLSDVRLRQDEEQDSAFASVRIFEECHGHYMWVVAQADLDADDPPVLGSHDGEAHVPFTRHLSEFLTAMTYSSAAFIGYEMQESLIGALALGVHGAFFRRTEGLVERYPRLPLVPLLGGNWGINSRWHGDEDTIIALSGESEIGSGVARTEAAWEKLRSTPGLEIED